MGSKKNFLKKGKKGKKKKSLVTIFWIYFLIECVEFQKILIKKEFSNKDIKGGLGFQKILSIMFDL